MYCLNRPFDDQEQERIHLESEAVRFILKHIRMGDFIWVGSSVLNLEIDRTPDIEKRDNVMAFMDIIEAVPQPLLSIMYATYSGPKIVIAPHIVV